MTDGCKSEAAKAKKALSTEAAPAYLADLVEKIALEKSRDAFSELFLHFAPRVKTYLMRLGSDAGQAEELAQETMLSAWRNAGQFDRSRAMPATWIFTIARNRRIDRLRRHAFTEFDLTDPILQGEAPDRPDDILQAEERDLRVKKAMESLPKEQAEIVRLAFYNDWAHAKIAEVSGLPLGTVKSRLRLAFAKLRESFIATDI